VIARRTPREPGEQAELGQDARPLSGSRRRDRLGGLLHEYQQVA
jgi:hypothetical protein